MLALQLMLIALSLICLMEYPNEAAAQNLMEEINPEKTTMKKLQLRKNNPSKKGKGKGKGNGKGKEPVCPDDKFKCSSHECIDKGSRCDANYDCMDGSDEKNCEDFECPEEKFRCSSGQCIRPEYQCDGDNDCSDNSDEEGCQESDNHSCYTTAIPWYHITTSELKGCPAEIPKTDNGKILAGRVYQEIGNDLPELSCNGACINVPAEIKQNSNSGTIPFSSAIINPGCTVYLFAGYNWTGEFKQYNGPATLSNQKELVNFCGPPDGYCAVSLFWTCKQTFPTCTPKDGWKFVAELDNSGSTISTEFTYEKTVGTTFSQSMKESRSVSESVSTEITHSFWDIFRTQLGTENGKTGYDWSKIDTVTKSEATSFTVQITVPPHLKVEIQDAVGTCGGSTINTQLFRVLDSNTGIPMKMYNGKVTSYTIS